MTVFPNKRVHTIPADWIAISICPDIEYPMPVEEAKELAAMILATVSDGKERGDG